MTGEANSAANASAPIVPRPIASCRSRFEPAGIAAVVDVHQPDAASSGRPCRTPAERGEQTLALSTDRARRRACDRCRGRRRCARRGRARRGTRRRDAASEASAPPPPAVGSISSRGAVRHRVEHRQQRRRGPGPSPRRTGCRARPSRRARRRRARRSRRRGASENASAAIERASVSGRRRAEVDQVRRVHEHRVRWRRRRQRRRRRRRDRAAACAQPRGLATKICIASAPTAAARAGREPGRRRPRCALRSGRAARHPGSLAPALLRSGVASGAGSPSRYQQHSTQQAERDAGQQGAAHGAMRSGGRQHRGGAG